MAIRRSDRRRLARLAMPLVDARRHEVEGRVKLREQAEFCVLGGLLLTVEGVDPETTCIAQHLREAQAKLAAIPDTEELQQTDDDYLARADTGWVEEEWRRGRRYRPPPREEETGLAEVERLMGRYRTAATEIDFAAASAFDLYAWCLSRHGTSYGEAARNAAKAAEDLLLIIDGLPDNPTEADLERARLAWENQ